MSTLTSQGPIFTTYPVFPIHIFVRVPFAGEKRMLFADDFPVEKGDHLRVFVRQVFDLQVATQVRVLLVYMLKMGNSFSGTVTGGTLTGRWTVG